MLKDLGIYRSTRNKWLFGVCAGISNHLGINPLWLRLGIIGAIILPAGLGIVPIAPIYILLALLMPKDTDRPVHIA